jgi:NADH-quinone oxidoreductase subunit L
MLFLTFYGQYRGIHHTEEHIHESPKSMTFPLIVLAVLSAIGGLIGIPEVLGGNHWLSHWLSPVIMHHAETPDHSTEYILMAVSVIGVLISIGVAYSRYIKQNHIPLPEEAKRPALANLSYHKFYIDEIYDAVVRRPLDAFSGFFYKIVDRKVVDGLVNGLGWGATEASKGLRLIQSGNVGFYIFMMVLGIISLLLYTYLSI